MLKLCVVDKFFFETGNYPTEFVLSEKRESLPNTAEELKGRFFFSR